MGKGKSNTIEVLISKALIDSYISHDEFFSVNNALRKYNEIKKEIKELCVIYHIKTMETDFVSVVRKILETKIQMSEKLNKTD